MSVPDPAAVAKHVIDLLGGRDAAFQKLDREYHHIMEVWDQDAAAIGRILRAHLFVEHFLTEYLRTKNPDLGSLNEARLSFAQKAALIDSKSAAVQDLLPGIRRVNQVRNRLAHSLHSSVSADDANALLECELFKAMRKESGKVKSLPPSYEPLDIFEDFALHVGARLQASFSETSSVWGEAWRLAQEDASSSKQD